MRMLMLMLLVLLGPFGCQCVTQVGRSVTTEFVVEPFVGIVADNVDVEFGFGAAAVSATGDEAVMPFLEVLVEDQVLIVRLRKDVFVVGISGDIQATITNPTLTSVAAADGSQFVGVVPGASELVIDADGSSEVSLTGIASNDVIVFANGSVVALEGSTNLLSVSCSNTEAALSQLVADDVEVTLDGSVADVTALSDVSGTIGAGSSLIVSGAPFTNTVEVSDDSTMTVE